MHLFLGLHEAVLGLTEMAGARCQWQQQQPLLHPPVGQVMKKPVPIKPKITPTVMSGQGSPSGLTKRPASSSSQGHSQRAAVQRSSTRQVGPNGWRAPRKPSGGAAERTEVTKEAEDEGYEDDHTDDYQDNEEEEEEGEEEKSRSWRRRRMEKKETSSGREQRPCTEPTKFDADQRRRPRTKEELPPSRNEDEDERRKVVDHSMDKTQIRLTSPLDRRKLTKSSLDEDYSLFVHDDDTDRESQGDSGNADSSSSLSSPLETPSTPPSLQGKPVELRSAQRLDEELFERLKGIRLDKDLTKQNALLVNYIQDCVLKYHNFFAKWTKCNQGSYYEKVKIREPDEYDCMLICEIRCKKNYYPAGIESKAYCTLKLNPTRNGAPHLSHREIHGPRDKDGGTFLSPKKFRDEFERNVRKALENFHLEKPGHTIEFRRHNGSSPAVTIDVRRAGDESRRGRVGEFLFSVDFVPAIRFMEWPDPAKEWHLRRLREVEKHLKEFKEPNIYPCAVAKIHPSEYMKTSEKSRLWRISFSAIEKYLILHADRGLSSVATCRKNVLRILKMDLVDLKQQLMRPRVRARVRARGGGEDDYDLGFSSFHLKTILLLLSNDREWSTNFADLSRDDSSWSKERLRQRYVDALNMVVDSLQMEYIEHYFIKDENLLNLQEIKKCDQKHIIEHFQLLCDKYS